MLSESAYHIHLRIRLGMSLELLDLKYCYDLQL